MKLLGVDYGEKRIGIAISDESGAIAFPKAVLPGDRNLLPSLTRIVSEEHISAIVFGESHNYNGTENRIMAAASACARALAAATGIPVYFEPEFLTSRQAEHIQGKTAATDASAAAIILQSYIDRTRI